MSSWWNSIGEGLAQSLEKVYEVLDAPVNVLAAAASGSTDEDGDASIADGEQQEQDQEEKQMEKQQAEEILGTVEKPKESQEEQGDTGSSSTSMGTSTEGVDVAEKRGRFMVLSALESVLQDVVHEGKKLADSSLEVSKKWAEDMKRDVETSNVLYQGFELGENLLSTSLSALETVGKSAADVIVQERNRSRVDADNTPSSSSSPSQDILLQSLASSGVTTLVVASTQPTAASSVVPSATSTRRAPSKKTFAKLFEDYGQGHLQALEMLGSEADTKSQTLEETTADESMRLAATQVMTLLNFEDAEAEIEAAEDLLLSIPAGLTSLEQMVMKTGLTVITPCNDMHNIVIGAIKFLGTTSESTPPTPTTPTAEKPKATILSIQDIQQNAIGTLAAFCGKSCEQLLRLAEHFLMMQSSQATTPVNDTVEAAKTLREFVMALLKDLSCLTNKYEQALQAVGEGLGQADAAADLSNGVLVDGSDAQFHVQDAAKYLAHILRRSILTPAPSTEQNEPYVQPSDLSIEPAESTPSSSS